QTGSLCGRAVALVQWHFRRRKADIEGEGFGALLAYGGRLRLPAEPAERLFAGLRVDSNGRLAADAVAVLVVGIGKSEDIGLVDRFDEAEAEHGLGDAR